MPVTMRDVARTAGVSINTVSRVVNGYGEVSPETRQRVLRAIEELGFRPNALARGLVSGRSLSVAFVIPQITDPFYPEVILGVENVARQHGYSVLLCNTNEDPEQELEYIEVLAAKQVDGIILCGSRLTDMQMTQAASRHRIVIITSRQPPGVSLISLCAREGLSEATKHLIRQGHHKIGHVGFVFSSGPDRVDGYRQALVEAGLVAEERFVVMTTRAHIETGYEAARQLLKRSPDITAITCFNDLVAIGVLRACSELGRRVPDDTAVVGFDDIALASLVSPALTTMHVPRFRLGEMSMELMLRVIADRGMHEERLFIRPELVVRASCGALSRSSWRADQSLREEEVIAAEQGAQRTL